MKKPLEERLPQRKLTLDDVVPHSSVSVTIAPVKVEKKLLRRQRRKEWRKKRRSSTGKS
ncbi:MAG: hypothetical protein ABIH36_02650 [bacterium]